MLSDDRGPVASVAFSADGKTLAVGLRHKDPIKLDKDGRWEEPAKGYAGAVLLYELKAGRR